MTTGQCCAYLSQEQISQVLESCFLKLQNKRRKNVCQNIYILHLAPFPVVVKISVTTSGNGWTALNRLPTFSSFYPGKTEVIS